MLCSFHPADSGRVGWEGSLIHEHPRCADVCILEPQCKVLIMGVVSEANFFSLRKNGGHIVPPCLGGLEVARYRMLPSARTGNTIQEN